MDVNFEKSYIINLTNILKRLITSCITILLLCSACLLANGQTLNPLVTSLDTVKEDSTKIKLLNQLGWKLRQTDPDQAKLYAEEAIAISVGDSNLDSNLSRLASYSYSVLGICQKNRGEFKQALVSFRTSLSLRNNFGSSEEVAKSYVNIGNLFRAQGKYDSAIVEYDLALVRMDTLSPSPSLGKVHDAKGISLYRLGKVEAGVKSLLRSYGIRQKLKDQAGVASSCISLGNFYRASMKYPVAKSFYDQAYAIYDSLGSTKGKVLVLQNQGNLNTDQHDFGLAISHYERAAALADSISAKPNFAEATANLASVYMLMGIPDSAELLLTEAFQTFSMLDDKEGLARCYYQLGELSELKYQFTEAAAYYMKADSLATALSQLALLTDIYRKRAVISVQQANYQDGFVFLAKLDSVSTYLSKELLQANHVDAEVNYARQQLLIQNEQAERESLEYFEKILLLIIGGIVLLSGSVLFWNRWRRKLIKNELELELNKNELAKSELNEKLIQKEIERLLSLIHI